MVRVLLVDDYPSIRTCMTEFLQDRGHDVCDVGDGESGLEALAAHDPQLILLDYNMPLMDGYDFSRALRTDPRYARWRRTPIIGIGEFPADKKEYIDLLVDKLQFLKQADGIIEKYSHVAA